MKDKQLRPVSHMHVTNYYPKKQRIPDFDSCAFNRQLKIIINLNKYMGSE